MPNPDHLSILNQGVDVWNKWREDNPVIVPDFSNSTLCRAELVGANFIRANFNRANLQSSNISMAYFKYASFRHAKLIDVNLCRSNFYNADLSYANLASANLTNVSLLNANLKFANLTEACLPYSELGGANFTSVNLRGADLSSASLHSTNFSNANLCGVKIIDAELGFTSFADADISEIIGLETVEHTAPSAISLTTFYNSIGKIPDVFLRGAGVPEQLIQYLLSMQSSNESDKPVEYNSCFISYNHKDQLFARRLHDTLINRGVRCWLDEKQMLPGDDISEHIDRGIRLRDKVLLCASNYSLNSWWVDNEMKIAFEKERSLFKDRGKKVYAIIPLNLDGYMFEGEWESGYKQQIKDRLAADFRGWEHDNNIFEREIENVIRALRTDRDTFDSPPLSHL